MFGSLTKEHIMRATPGAGNIAILRYRRDLRLYTDALYIQDDRCCRKRHADDIYVLFPLYKQVWK